MYVRCPQLRVSEGVKVENRPSMVEWSRFEGCESSKCSKRVKLNEKCEQRKVVDINENRIDKGDDL